jgi:dTDP-4-amino-4,6-dideoxygalactose transaminase
LASRIHLLAAKAQGMISFNGLDRQYQSLKNEIDPVASQVYASGKLMNGRYTEQFETWLARYNNSRHAITVHSGTHALEAVAEFHRRSFPYAPTVLIPALTYRATANAFKRAGWHIRFVDTDRYGLLNFDSLPEKIDYEAVVIVGLYGASVAHMGNQRQWQDWLYRDTLIIEDGAQHWLADSGTRVGTATAISFDPTKNLPCYGNGGAVVTRDSALAEFVRNWRGNSMTSGTTVGTNSRMSELDCALMMVKANHIHQWQNRRRDIAAYYNEQFAGTAVKTLITDDMMYNHCFHKFVIEVDNRDQLQQDLAARGIETKIHYAKPLHEEPIYSCYPGPSSLLSCSSTLSRRVLSLPIYPELTDSEVEHIAAQVKLCTAD